MKRYAAIIAVLCTSVLITTGAVAGIAAPAPAVESPKTGVILAADAGTDDSVAVRPKANADDSNRLIMKRSIRYSVLIAIPINFWIASIFMWDWKETRPFLFANEGWYSQRTYSGGADKAAHFFAHYMVMRSLYNIYNYTEDGRSVKWAYSIGMISFLSLSIEIGDAFSRKQNGFSYEDLLSGFAGIGLGVLLERFPMVDHFVSLSAEYYPTRYVRRHSALGPKLFLEDYSGWRFLANIKLAGFNDMGVPIPGLLRFVMIDIGYGTRGFTPTDNPLMHRMHLAGKTRRHRDIFFGLSLNMMEMIKELFTDRDSLACRALQQPFKYYHVPVGYSVPVHLSR